ncbi:ABC transporter G family member 23 [Anabrus simplex]|uniref:ABC transporter G family member 23 n=1 Tax=Anabrus simplex TaxID=316456 RepID=UPI0034DDA9AD
MSAVEVGVVEETTFAGEDDVVPPVADKRHQLFSRQSSVWTRRQQAVCVRRAYKRYGSKKNPNVILDGLNMTVPKGVIYGLLGASGCGKTTLLTCVVGRRRLDSGEIWVLGGRPGSRGSGVPGPRIGYMPQELALYGEFSIRETLLYYGWVNGMTTKEVDEKLEFLINLLMLPPANRFVKNLSGGQQRRVSIAAALVHDPELLILDEPTVGVDPVLRQNIWDHLVQVTGDGNRTVIITTHYIEETRQAHKIGLMRGGRFLAEESPAQLMASNMCDSLEEVFLKLSKKQNQGKRRRSSFMQEVMANLPPIEPTYDQNSEISGEFGDNVSLSNRDVEIPQPGETIDLPPEEEPETKITDYFKIVAPNRMKALLWKNFLWMWRNVGVMLFVFGLPILETALYCWSIGRDPAGLHIGIVNKEMNDTTQDCMDTMGCNLDLLSCRYIQHLRTQPIKIDKYGEEEEAFEAVRRGYAWASMTFEGNYSESLVRRMEDGRSADPFTVDFAEVRVTMDMSNQHIGQMLKKYMLLSYLDFARDILQSCNYSTRAAGVPIRFNTPVYGEKEPNFREFAAPGVILTIVFFLAVAQTVLTMMLERNEGMMERSLVSGITVIEILFSHVICQFIIMFGQAALVIIFSFPVFGIASEGNFWLVSFLVLLTGLCGLCYGFVVSVVCDNERSATYMALGSFLPVVMLCGVIWPTEGMHYSMKLLSYVMPLTQSTESLRSILARGWTLKRPTVYFGFVSVFVWIAVFLSASVLVLKFKKA